MRLRVALLAFSLIAWAPNQAFSGDQITNSSTDSTGNYDSDLGQIQGAIISAKFRTRICSKSFPENTTKYAEEYSAWRSKYLPFIQMIQTKYQDRLWDIANHDKKQLGLVMKHFAEADVEYEVGLENLMKSDGADEFKAKCDSLSDFFSADFMDLENSMSEQLETVRRGPPPAPRRPNNSFKGKPLRGSP